MDRRPIIILSISALLLILVWLIVFGYLYISGSEINSLNFINGNSLNETSGNGLKLIIDYPADYSEYQDSIDCALNYDSLYCADINSGYPPGFPGNNDECKKDSDCDGKDYSDKYCKTGDVYRDYYDYSCEDSECERDKETRLIEECDYGCSNGKCIGPVIECYNDSECDDSDIKTIDRCVNPGTTSSYCENKLVKCSSDLECGTNGYLDEYECSSNDLFRKFLTYKCISPGTADSYCTNPVILDPWADCGEDYCETPINHCVNGDVYSSKTHHDLGCSNGGCFDINSREEQLIEECSYGCSDGKCISVNIKCYKNSDCNDSNNYTYDECVSPGTPDSYCTNNQIKCLKDSDCGTNGFVDSVKCSNNDVFQNFITYKCESPGSVNSKCSSATELKLKTDCNSNQLCSDSRCVDVKCFKDSDCNDNNSNTVDKCVSPGTVSSKCTNTCTSGSYTFKNGAEIRDFVNSLKIYTYIPNDSDWNTGALAYDDKTIAKVCELKGYPVVSSKNPSSYTSCSDNTIAFWSSSKNNFVVINACDYNKMVDVLTCKRVC